MLPKISHPTFNIIIPSTKKKVLFRRFLVKEEKLLLIAKESKLPEDILHAIKQIVTNCIIDTDVNINKLTLFDLEYIFLKLRANSVDNISKISYVDPEDNKPYTFEIDLNEIEVIFPENISNIIRINDNIGIVLKYPSAALYDDTEFLNLKTNHFFELILKSVDKIYEGDKIYEDATKKELEEFFDNLDGKAFLKVQEFFLNLPSIKHTISYTNTLGKDKQIVLNSLSDFFTFR